MAEITITYGDFSFKSENGYPTPNLSFDIENIRTSAGDYLMSEKNITLQGVCYANRLTSHDNAANTGVASVEKLFKLASGLQNSILKQNNKVFFVKCGNQKPLLSGNAIVQSVQFNDNDNNWTQTVDYTVELKILTSGQYYTNAFLTSGIGNYVSNVSDNYSIQLVDSDKYIYQNAYVPIYKISRTISAVGKRVASASGALYFAKKWVNDREQSSPITGMLPLKHFKLYNQERNVELDESAGTYTIVDNFIAKSGDPWIDNYDISVEVDDNFLRTITINGSIQGLELATGIYKNTSAVSGIGDIYPTVTGNLLVATKTIPYTNTKYDYAVSGYGNIKNLIAHRIYAYDTSTKNLITNNWHGKNNFSNYKSSPINNIPLSSSESLFPFDGKITYSRTYNSRPMSIMTGALFENFQINSSLPTARVKEIKILGRKLGPLVYEYYNSSGLGSISVSYEAVFAPPTGLKKYSFPQGIVNAVNDLVKLYQPLPPYTGYIKQNTQNINLTENKIVRTMVWEYTTCGQ